MEPNPPPQPDFPIHNPGTAPDPGGARVRSSRLSFVRRWSAGGCFTLLALLIWLAVHSDYGITWDESVQSAYGEAVREYFSGQLNYAQFTHAPGLPENIYYYAPALDLVCATIARVFGADIFSVRHGVQGLLWVAMFYPVCALGRRISGRPGAWFAGLALLGMPALFGQAFNNPKDLPLACAAIWLLHASVTVAGARRLDWSHAWKLGGALGFLLAMRPGAWFLGALAGLVPLVHGWRTPKPAARRLKTMIGTLPVLVAAAVTGWLLMVLPWPNAWHSPLLHPLQSARLALHFQEVYPVLLRGTIYPSNRLPWDYLATYLLLTLPPPFLLLGAWGHLVLWRKRSRSRLVASAVLGIAFLIWFPLVTFVVLRPNIYDGMRHFLFILPPLAVVVGVAAADAGCWLQNRLSWLAWPLLAGITLSAVPAMFKLHPYENVYFNFLAGPKATLHERYETDYWASSYREAAEWINQAQSHRTRPLCVLVAASDFSYPAFTHYLNPEIKAVHVPLEDLHDASLTPEADFYVATVRYGQWQNFSGAPIVKRIERDDILLSVIRKNPGN